LVKSKIDNVKDFKNNALIGIMMLDTSFTRISGDIGNPDTYNFPVLFKVVKGALPERVAINTDIKLINPFIEAAKELEELGVKAITTSCGFLALFQKQVAQEVKIPVFTSSLIQVPLVSQMIGKDKKVGIITANSKNLTRKHLQAVNITDDIGVVIAGMEDEPYFQKVFIWQSIKLNKRDLEKEIVKVGKNLVKENPKIGAIVFECTNMPPYARALQDEVDLPIFDVVTLTNMVYETVKRQDY
jgi:Asp/Glu/hydantoin racemase